ncbi:MAG TPA: enoyl-CoA hydratase/isomerase family protein [Allosphingosinicella sp.]|nr:enoyl-CoA hydratase/isomerase family protein [Allosphingosinicella sp.]
MFALSIEKQVARLVIDRPEARNAIPASQWQMLAASAVQAEREGARLLIVSGTRGAFCAGADLGDFPALAGDEAARVAFRLSMRRACETMADLSIPTIAAIDGPCFGAGVALAMACDIRIAGPNARFAITPAKLGISYPQEDVHRLVSLAGAGQAARLLFGAAAIDGAEAARIGLVERYSETVDRFEEELESLTASILANSAHSLALLKRSIRLAAAGTASDRGQDQAFDACFGSGEFEARLAALRPKAAAR